MRRWAAALIPAECTEFAAVSCLTYIQTGQYTDCTGLPPRHARAERRLFVHACVQGACRDTPTYRSHRVRCQLASNECSLCGTKLFSIMLCDRPHHRPALLARLHRCTVCVRCPCDSTCGVWLSCFRWQRVSCWRGLSAQLDLHKGTAVTS